MTVCSSGRPCFRLRTLCPQRLGRRCRCVRHRSRRPNFYITSRIFAIGSSGTRTMPPRPEFNLSTPQFHNTIQYISSLPIFRISAPFCLYSTGITPVFHIFLSLSHGPISPLGSRSQHHFRAVTQYSGLVSPTVSISISSHLYSFRRIAYTLLHAPAPSITITIHIHIRLIRPIWPITILIFPFRPYCNDYTSSSSWSPSPSRHPPPPFRPPLIHISSFPLLSKLHNFTQAFFFDTVYGIINTTNYSTTRNTDKSSLIFSVNVVLYCILVIFVESIVRCAFEGWGGFWVHPSGSSRSPCARRLG